MSESAGPVEQDNTSSPGGPPGPPETSPSAPPPLESPPLAAAELGDALLFRSAAAPGDGAVDIRVAADWMEALATFHPPRDDGRPLRPEQVLEALARAGVSEGILEAEIAEAVLRCNLDRETIRELPVARGLPPQSATPEHGSVEERFAPRETFASLEAIKVDFRDLSRLPVVRKGEVLGRLHPAAPGRSGRDIRGRELEPERLKVDNWKPGKNVLVEEDRMLAAAEGLLERQDFTLSVEEVFVVRGGVDYHTGHIVFPGDVIVEGKVGDGFKLWSGATIVCRLTLDAFDVNAKKDLLCQQGILGHGTGHVRVGGNLEAKFIENCRVAARGDIRVHSALMGSHVFSLGRIDLGDKGSIVGGETWAVHGIRAARLGNQAKQRTLLHVGVDFSVQQRLDQANERLRSLALRAQQIDVYAASHPGVDRARLHAEAAKAVEETRNLIVSLLPTLDGDEEAYVEVSGDIWPGTVIEICRGEITVTKPLHGCRFRLDKAGGRILVEPLSGRPEGGKIDAAPAKAGKEAPKPHRAEPPDAH